MAAIAAVVALAGCAAQQPKTALREGRRMVDLYRDTVAPEPGRERADAAAAGSRQLCRWWLFRWPCEAVPDAKEPTVGDRPSYARTAANELELLFPRLPNPDVYIYILPHLATGSRVPVPGYTTAVPLYERVEYALPGETALSEGEGGPGPADTGRAEPEPAP